MSRPAASDCEAACARADVGAHRDVHADEAGGARQDRTEEEADRHRKAEQPTDKQEDHHADDGDGHVLAAQVGGRALGDRARDLLHARRTGVGGHERLGRPDAIDHGQKPAAMMTHKAVFIDVSLSSAHGGPPSCPPRADVAARLVLGAERLRPAHPRESGTLLPKSLRRSNAPGRSRAVLSAVRQRFGTIERGDRSQAATGSRRAPNGQGHGRHGDIGEDPPSSPCPSHKS